MYSNAPAIQTYNPAASTDGSAHPMHSVPAANQPYYSLPAQQMSLPPGAPATYGTGQPAATMGQPQYNIPPQGVVGGGGGYQPHTVPGGPTAYQTSAMPTQHPPPAQMYMPSSTSSAPQQSQPGAAEYQPYSMQGKCCHHTVTSVVRVTP